MMCSQVANVVFAGLIVDVVSVVVFTGLIVGVVNVVVFTVSLSM